MALRMQIQSTAFGSYTEYDLPGNGCGQFRLTVSYSAPAVLRWVMHQAQHTTPIGFRKFIRFWDDAGTDPDGVAFSASNPLFEGFVEEIQPKESMLLEYAAYDPTYRAGKEIPIMSQTWPQGTVDTVPPVPASNAVPRIIFNASIDNDDDWAFQRGPSALTVGNMMATIFGDQYHPLYWANAAPGDGTSAGNGTPYNASEMNAMTIIPQEKQVFQSETLRTAIDRLVTANYPSRRLIWIPGTRKWSMPDITAATARTVTLNQFDGSNDVLSMELHRSIERRHTAVKFYGPETLTTTIASTQDGTLSTYGNYTVLETIGAGTTIRSFNRWIITNPNRRRMGRVLPAPVLAPVGTYNWIVTRSPTLQMSWDGRTWITIWGAYFDYQQGIASVYPGHVYFWDRNGYVTSAGLQRYFPPVHVRLVYPFFDAPITVRYPTSGYSGTAYDVAGIAAERSIYDEMLAIGYERGTPVTSVQRLAQFSALAEQLHKESKDILYVGGFTFNDTEYDWCRLNRSVHIAAVDEDGNTVTTGWEAIGAWVTDVEYDLENRTTTIQFNSDQGEMIGLDVETMKERLGIRALIRRQTFYQRLMYSWAQGHIWGNWYQYISGVQWWSEVLYIDPLTGEAQIPIH